MQDGSVDLGNTALGSKRRGSFRLCWCSILIIGRFLGLMKVLNGGLKPLNRLVGKSNPLGEASLFLLEIHEHLFGLSTASIIVRMQSLSQIVVLLQFALTRFLKGEQGSFHGIDIHGAIEFVRRHLFLHLCGFSNAILLFGGQILDNALEILDLFVVLNGRLLCETKASTLEFGARLEVAWPFGRLNITIFECLSELIICHAFERNDGKREQVLLLVFFELLNLGTIGSSDSVFHAAHRHVF